MERQRIRLVVDVDLDPIPGAFYAPESAQHFVQLALNRTISSYNPEVRIEDLNTSLLVQLELVLHDADCTAHDKNFIGHGDKYTKLARAAASVFPSEREPYWLKDRKLVQENSLNLILQRIEELKEQIRRK